LAARGARGRTGVAEYFVALIVDDPDIGTIGGDAFRDSIRRQAAGRPRAKRRAGRIVDVHVAIGIHNPDFVTRRGCGDAAWRGIGTPQRVMPQVQADEPSSKAPIQLGEYRILQELGRGGMGVVYLAEQTSLGRQVALKILPLAAVLDPRQLQRFRNEVQATALLQHTHIVPIYAVGNEKGIHYYTMMYVEGRTLAEIIDHRRSLQGLDDAPYRFRGSASSHSFAPSRMRSKPFSGTSSTGQTDDQRGDLARPAEPSRETVAQNVVTTAALQANKSDYYRWVAHLVIQAAEALDYAHRHGVVHRDVKPGNLLVDETGNLWVTDFGVARLEAEVGVTITGDLPGTLRYMSPEQTLGKRSVIDYRSDVYSLGATLYELLTLQPMHRGENRHELLQQIATADPRPPRRLDPKIPRELETITLKAIEKNPTDRYATAEAMAEDLRRMLTDRPIQARRQSVATRVKKWSYRHGRLLLTSFFTALLATTIGLVWTWQAFRSASSERARARQNYRMALDTLDEIFRVSWHLERTPQLAAWQRTVLENSLKHYQAFIDQNRDDPDVQHEMLRALDRQSQLHHILDDFEQSAVACQQAIRLGEEMIARGVATLADRERVAAVTGRLAAVQHDRGEYESSEASFARAEKQWIA
jgi:eukaryotic-like serine/threonine-protein kinase